MYPAVSTLFAMGKASVPHLLKVIRETEADQVKVRNALDALMLIYGDNKPTAIRLLNKESAARASAGDFVESDRLRKAAVAGAGHCFSAKEACENALNEKQQ